ncbi:hypothetical protein ACJMK2_028845 [Sinanodonta woodiana]|uniref:Uncharacterized protein n=1 Tax=Sinanodonta woodiana TaxID=1069815 RepID=A0ABD3XCC3_SINWO
MLRTNVSRSNSLGNYDTPFELDNVEGVHSCEEIRAPQSRELNLFPNIDTAKATVQGYDHITFEKMPPKGINNYDMMIARVDFLSFDSTYSHIHPETFSSERFRPIGYSHISFDNAGTGEQPIVRVDTIRESRQTDGYSHIEFESKPSASITNPIRMSEPTIIGNYSYATIQSTNDTQGSIGSSRLRETVLDRDSSSHVDFNGKQSRADDMTIRIEKDTENYNYAKVNLNKKSKC